MKQDIQICQKLVQIKLDVASTLTLFCSMDTRSELGQNSIQILARVAHGFFPLRVGQLAVQVDQGDLPFIFLDTHDYHVARAIARNENRFPGLSAKVGDLIGVVAQVRNRSDSRHDAHILSCKG